VDSNAPESPFGVDTLASADDIRLDRLAIKNRRRRFALAPFLLSNKFTGFCRIFSH
jgi:hypothetical protein